MSILDEECHRPKGSDEGFVSKATTLHIGHPDFAKPKELRFARQRFTIRHYAGDVEYTSGGFVDKNKVSFLVNSVSPFN